MEALLKMNSIYNAGGNFKSIIFNRQHAQIAHVDYGNKVLYILQLKRETMADTLRFCFNVRNHI